MKLFYIILGATPKGRNTEQHDVFFGIAKEVYDLKPEIDAFWPEAKGKIHMDAYMEVQFIDSFEIKIVEKQDSKDENHLYFLNLGGYKPGVFQELHEKMLMVSTSMAKVIKRAKKTPFYKKMSYTNADSHIDDKYGVDVDDLSKVTDLLTPATKEKYTLKLIKTDALLQENPTFIGYYKFKK